MVRRLILAGWVFGTLFGLPAALWAADAGARASERAAPTRRAPARGAGQVSATAGEIRVTLRSDGAITVRGPKGSRGQWRGSVGLRPGPRARLVARRVAVRQGGRTYPVLHLRMVDRGGPREAVLWLRRRGRIQVLWRGATGPQGADQAWSRHLEVTPRGVLLYQRTAALSRCDGLSPRMLARGYHFASGRMLPVLLRPVSPVGAVTLEAAPTPPPGVRSRPLVPYRFDSASSEVGCQGEARAVSPPSELHDGRPGTAWIEGQGGPGSWEFATAHAVGAPDAVRAVRILPGHGARPAQYNRLRVAWLLLGPHARFRVRFPRDPLQGGKLGPWWVVLPRPVRSRCLTLVIESVYPGATGDTAVSELSVFTEADFGDPVARTLRAVTAARMDREEAVRRLVRVGPADLVRLRAALPKTASPLAQEVVLRVLARRDAAASAPLLARAVPTAAPGFRRVLLGALSGLGARGVAVLAPLLRETPRPAVLGAVARALVRSNTPEGLQVLLRSLGRGDIAARQQLVSALGAAPAARLGPALLAALARPGTAAAWQQDVLAVAARLARRAPSFRSALAMRLSRAWRAYGSFGAQIRLLDLAGRLAAPALLPRLLAATAAGQDPILRERALRALASYPGPRAARAIQQALGAKHPRVRRGAVWAWARRRDTGGVAAVAALAEKDPWPLVREAALRGLSRRCDPAGYPVLYRVARHRGPRRQEGLRRLALVGLVGCGAPTVPRLLGEILTDDHDRVSMRRLVVRILGHRRNRTHLGYLIAFLDLLARKVTRARGSNEALAADLAAALGHIGDARAVPVLVRAARVGRLPQMRAAALSALGRFCGAPGARAAVLRAVRPSESRLVQGAALKTARRCGFLRAPRPRAAGAGRPLPAGAPDR